MKKTVALLLFLALLIGCLFSCAKTDKYTRSFLLMDTVITLTLYTDDAALASQELDTCQSLLEELDALWSRHREGSDISRINHSANGCGGLDARTVGLLTQALEISAATNGCFDITLAPITDLWERCEKENRLPSQLELFSVLARTGSKNLSVSSDGSAQKTVGMHLDLGGIAKGAAVSLLLEHLRTTELSGGLISFGSNVAVFGEKPSGEPFRISLRDPKNKDATVGTLTLSDGQVLSVSGDYERYVTIQGQNYHHILDPSTARPADTGLASVSVIASDGALADALSTALFVMGEEEAQRFYQSHVYEFEAIFITSDGEISTTAGLGDLFVPAEAQHAHLH